MTIKEKINFIISNTLNILRSFIFCIRVLPFQQACKMPILLHFRVKIKVSRGDIKINCDQTSFAMIRIGVEGSKGISRSKRGYINTKHGTLIFHGHASLGKGIVLRIENKGIIEFGNWTHLNCNALFICRKHIELKDDVLFGWNVTVLDNDGHSISYYDDVIKAEAQKITIGEHVWIGANSMVLKNTVIMQGSIVAAHTVINKAFDQSNILICGVPGKIKKTNVRWLN